MGIEKQYNKEGMATEYGTRSVETEDKDIARAFLRERIQELDRESHILDIGCGNGLDLKAYQQMGFSNLYGVDASEKILQEAQEELGDEVKLAVGSFEQLPFEAEVFDGITARFSLHYAQDIDRALREVARVLKPEGTLLAVISNPEADALEEVDAEGNVTITLFDGNVSITFPQHSMEGYFSDTFDELFRREELFGYSGEEQDRDTGDIPNALCFSAVKK